MNYVLDLDTLIAHMQEQIASLKNMNSVLDNQEDAVRRNDVDRVLETISQLQGELVERVRLEGSREHLMTQWAGELGCTPEEVTVSKLVHLDPIRGDKLKALSLELHQAATEVQAKQQYCKALLHSELRFISHLVDALYPGRNAGTYSPGDSTPQMQPAMSLDVRG